MKLILASRSPRRKALLSAIGFPFEVKPAPPTDETFPNELVAEDIPRYIARKKAEACLPFLANDELLLTADTIVWFNGTLMGKPANRNDAFRMLQTLSAQTHQVITAVCLTTQQQSKTFTDSSAVTFAPLDSNDILYYIDHYHPYDKAGAYGIQDWLGAIAVERIEGSFTNIMGLPLQRLYNELRPLFPFSTH